MKKIVFWFFVFSFLVLSCSDDKKPEDLSGQLNQNCKTGNVCNDDLVCDKDNKCILKEEACKYITCSSKTDNLSHGTCIVENSKVACECETGYARTGYTGTKCEPTNICTGITCSNHGVCEDNNGEPKCKCDSGYSPDATGEHCIKNTDPCANINCGGSDRGTCSSEGGTLHCICETGYHAQGLTCISDTNPCEGVDCGGSDKGTCEVNGTEAVCNCKTGFTANGLICVDENNNPCTGQDCSNHGTCEVHNDEATCICDGGYTPGENLTCVENSGDACDSISCGEHGTCILNNGIPACDCDAGYVANGLSCVADTPEACNVEGMCYDKPEHGTLHGHCVLDDTEQAKCICDDGYLPSGYLCIPDIGSPCYEQTCSDNGVCKVGYLDVPYCECNDDYITSGDDNLSCISVTEACSGQTCGGNGTCVSNGYNGITCECNNGFVAVGLNCVANPCLNNPCYSVANAVNDICVAHSDASYSCQCEVGFYWDSAQQLCLDSTEDCDEDNMHPDGGACVCDADYTFDNESEMCLPSSGDLCDPNPCAARSNSKCVVNENTGTVTVSCVCKDGYASNSSGECVTDVCADDPCYEDHKSVCSKDGNTFKCSCDSGYILDENGNCKRDDSLCNANSCTGEHMTGVCQVLQGSIICQCDTGYTGENCDVFCSDCNGVANATGDCSVLDYEWYHGQWCTCETGYNFEYELNGNNEPTSFSCVQQ